MYQFNHTNREIYLATRGLRDALSIGSHGNMPWAAREDAAALRRILGLNEDGTRAPGYPKDWFEDDPVPFAIAPFEDEDNLGNVIPDPGQWPPGTEPSAEDATAVLHSLGFPTRRQS